MKNKADNVLDVISKISSLEFQNDVWIEGKYWDRVTSFEEAVNTLDDYEFFDDVDGNRIGLSDKEQIKVKYFLNKLLNYNNRPPIVMISDKAWHEIVKEADEIYLILKKYSW